MTATRKHVSPKTTGRRLTSLRAFAKWAKWGEVLQDYNAPTPPRTIPHPLPEGIEGVYRLISTSTVERQKSLIALCGLMGCRVSEALSIRPSDFDLPNMVLTIRGKGDRTRYVPISSRAWEILQVPYIRAAATNEPIVGMKDRAARGIIKSLGKRARLKRPISSHDLRATFATAVHDKTLNIRITQELLGHASLMTTQIYTAVNEEKYRSAVEL